MVVIGVGIFGVVVVEVLVSVGFDVVIFEKSCGFGGRMLIWCYDDGIVFDYGV